MNSKTAKLLRRLADGRQRAVRTRRGEARIVERYDELKRAWRGMSQRERAAFRRAARRRIEGRDA